MLKIEDRVYLKTVVEFAKRTGRTKQLQKELHYLATYAEHGKRGVTRCRLFKDFAPMSFYFLMEKWVSTAGNKDEFKEGMGEYQRWFNGGLIFHGALNPCDGWQIHT